MCSHIEKVETTVDRTRRVCALYAFTKCWKANHLENFGADGNKQNSFSGYFLANFRD